MKLSKKISTIALILILCASVQFVTFAVTLNIQTQGQQKSNWCWAASSVSIANFRGKNTTQLAHVIAATVYSANVTRTQDEVANDFIKIYSFSVSNRSSSLPNSDIINNIQHRQMPIFVIISWNGGGRHSVVVSGIDSPSLFAVRIMDPSPVGVGSHTWVPLSTLRNSYKGSGTWSGTITGF